MCGIAGVFARPDARSIARRMTDAIAHRGRDGYGDAELRDERGDVAGAVGHRRLAVIDLSDTGCQPMITPDERYSIVFNGEIYNFRALREELERSGATFRGTSDTEVILAGWRAVGPRFAERLRGMFAFALWDRETSTGWLVRDPLGIKPLYIARTGGSLLFGSEVRAILASGLVAPVVSPVAVDGFLAYGSVPEPHSIIEGVEALPAGAVMRVRATTSRATVETEFITDPFAVRPASLETDPHAAAMLVRDALRDSVAHHLVADVPVALFLSGGIDSSAVAAFAAEASSARLDGFTVVFDEAQFDESAPARAVAKRFGFRHREIPLAANDLLSALPAAFDAMDQPSLDGLNTFVVSRAVREAGTKVVLSGLGGDEMFAGYPSFRRAARAQRLWGMLPRPARALAARMLDAGSARFQKAALLLDADDPARGAYLASRTLFTAKARRALAGGRDRHAEASSAPSGLTLLQRVSWYELTGYMRDTLLRDSDVLSMSHHLELRVPFVDRRVLEASLSVADSVKLHAAINKPLIVAAMGDLMPREVWDRPKQGFTLPFAPWMRGPLRDEIASAMLSPERMARIGIDPEAARGIWTRFLAGSPEVTWSRPWALYTLVRWAERLDAAASPSREPGLALSA